MKILVLGGTRYAGIHLVNALLANCHDVTIATRGKTPDNFKDAVKHKIIDRQDSNNLRAVFQGESYDVVVDNLAYCSNDVRSLLESIHTTKYIMTSTVSVYNNFHMDMQEAEIDAKNIELKWCGREEHAYDEIKRQAEAALFQVYTSIPSVAVRFPWIFGKDDYTERLFYYIEHIFNEKPMNVDNLDARLVFINSAEAGHFLAWCAENAIFGTVNASSNGTISLYEIIEYTEKRTGKKALIQEQGDIAPLNSVPNFSLNTTKAQKAGYSFQNVSEWVYATIDYWIDNICAV